MSYRSIWVLLSFSLLLLGAAGAGVVLLRYEHAWYAKAAVPPGPLRQQRSDEFSRVFCDLFSDISNEREWYSSFTDEQINSYFEEGFVHSGLAARLLPEDISHPRVAIEPDRIRLAFRYGRGAWSSVVSADLRVWLAPSEPNVMVLELEGCHIGALPISVQSILEKVADVARQNGIDVSWYRHPETGHPVAVLRFQADQPRPTLQLRALHLTQGTLTIHGRSNDAGALRAMLALPNVFALHPIAD
jgi:hypothetical protein